MTTAEVFENFNTELRIRREEDLKSVLNDFFENNFISRHRRWRAVVGNRRCKPIPIYQYFRYPDEPDYCCKYEWPNLSEEVLRQTLIKLGFTVTEHKISLCVPACEKGKKLTFAQEWVKKINDSYAKYCAKEKKLARELYQEFLFELRYTSNEKVKLCEGYILFLDFEFNREISPRCAAYIRKMMSHDGIEEYYENGEYKGYRAFTTPSN